MYLEEKAHMKQCINYIDSKLEKLPTKKRQWVWFIILWLFALSCVLTLGYIIKFAMGV